MPAPKWPFAVLAVLAVVISSVLALRHQRAAVVRTEIALAKDEQRELSRLRAEKQRLVAEQVSAAEFERLRADRAAVLRLRAEVDALRARTEQMERAVAPAPAAIVKPQPGPRAMALKIGVDADGQLSFEERALDLNTLRARLATLRRGDSVTIGLQLPEPGKLARTDGLKADIERFMNLARELGLRMEVRLEHPSFTVQQQPMPKS